MAALPAEHLDHVVLTVHPSVGLVCSAYPVVSLWGASSGLMDPGAVDMDRAEDALLVRRGLEVETRGLPAGGGAFLGAIMDGFSLSVAAAHATRATAAFELHLHLAGLFDAGCFTDLQADADASESHHGA